MQMDKNDMKLEQSVSMHFHEHERPCKPQTVTDPKSRNTAKQPLWGMKLQERMHEKRLQDTENLFRKNLQLKDVC